MIRQGSMQHYSRIRENEEMAPSWGCGSVTVFIWQAWNLEVDPQNFTNCLWQLLSVILSLRKWRNEDQWPWWLRSSRPACTTWDLFKKKKWGEYFFSRISAKVLYIHQGSFFTGNSPEADNSGLVHPYSSDCLQVLHCDPVCTKICVPNASFAIINCN